MIPGERSAQEPSEFPFLDLVVGVLALYAILAVTIPDNPLHAIVALAAFFSMGYAAVALVAGGRLRLTAAETLAFSVGLMILFTAVSALGVSIVGIRITQFAVIIIGLPMGVITWLLRRPRVRVWTALADFLRRYADFSDYSRGEKAIAAILFIAVLVALAAYVSLAALHYTEDPSMGIALTGPDGTAGSLPTTFEAGVAQRVTVTVLGDEVGGAFDLRIRLVARSGTCGENFTPVTVARPTLQLGACTEYAEPITVAPQGTWRSEPPYSIVLDEPGAFWLRFDLVDANSTVVTWAQIPVTIA